MTMFERIKQALMAARKSSDRPVVTSLSTLLGEFGRARDKSDPTDQEVFSVLSRFEASLLEMIKIKPDDEALKAELELIRSFLVHKPKPATEEEITEVVKRLISEQQEATIKSLMPLIKSEFGQRFNGALTQQVLKSLL